MESMNAELIKLGVDKKERLKNLNKMAIEQMKVLLKVKSIKELDGENKNAI